VLVDGKAGQFDRKPTGAVVVPAGKVAGVAQLRAVAAGAVGQNLVAVAVVVNAGFQLMGVAQRGVADEGLRQDEEV
jgi:hypothetical protein